MERSRRRRDARYVRSSTFWKNVAALGYRQHAAQYQHGFPYHCSSPLLAPLLQIKPTTIHLVVVTPYVSSSVLLFVFENEGQWTLLLR